MRISKLIPVVPLLVAALLTGCGNSEPARADSTLTTTRSSTSSTASTASTSSTTAAPQSTAPSGNVLAEGVWTSPAQDLLVANLANLGSTPINCDGQVRMSLENGHIRHGGDLQCSMPQSPVVATGTVDSEGSYTLSGDQLTVTNSVTNGQVFLNGQPLMPINTLTDMNATLQVDGDTMTITFTTPQVGTVTQTWHRTS